MPDFTDEQAREALAFAHELRNKIEDDYEPTPQDIDRAARLMSPILRVRLGEVREAADAILEALPLSVELYTIETDESIREFVELTMDLANGLYSVASLIRLARRRR